MLVCQYASIRSNSTICSTFIRASQAKNREQCNIISKQHNLIFKSIRSILICSVFIPVVILNILKNPTLAVFLDIAALYLLRALYSPDRPGWVTFVSSPVPVHSAISTMAIMVHSKYQQRGLSSLIVCAYIKLRINT